MVWLPPTSSSSPYLTKGLTEEAKANASGPQAKAEPVHQPAPSFLPSNETPSLSCCPSDGVTDALPLMITIIGRLTNKVLYQNLLSKTYHGDFHNLLPAGPSVSTLGDGGGPLMMSAAREERSGKDLLCNLMSMMEDKDQVMRVSHIWFKISCLPAHKKICRGWTRRKCGLRKCGFRKCGFRRRPLTKLRLFIFIRKYLH